MQRGHLHMLKQLKNRKSEGFTIIEVLIVLAIAALILLIVFLAVPALQRSSRNTQRKNDASAIAGAVANYISNNGGSLPVAWQTNGTDPNSLDICGASCGTGNTETAKLGLYDPANVKIVDDEDAATVGALDKDHVVIDTNRACDPNNVDVGDHQTRTAAIRYAVESASGNVSQQCVEQ